MVVTRHISHDGLLIGPQGANDVCPGHKGRKRGEEERRGEKKASVKKCRDTSSQQGESSQEETASHFQVTFSLIRDWFENMKKNVLNLFIDGFFFLTDFYLFANIFS